MTNIDAMTEREMDVAVATGVMGWIISERIKGHLNWQSDTGETWPVDDWDCDECGNTTLGFRPTYNHGAAYEMEEELKRRDLMHHYIVELANECDADMGVTTYDMLWKLTHATPLQRVKAALRVVMKDDTM
jgi:hypothetical protein